MSTTYIALLVNAIIFIAPHFGLTVADPNTLTGIIVEIVGVLATVWAFYGRYRLGGINIFGLRKS